MALRGRARRKKRRESFARLRWPSRDLWFLVLAATLMLPVLFLFFFQEGDFIRGIVFTRIK